jgi:hypothetical protein
VCGHRLTGRTEERRLVTVLFADLVGFTTLAERRAHRSFGVVLVRDGRTEEGQQGVTHDLVDTAAEAHDLVGEAHEATVDEVLDLLGVAGLGQRREADDVGEHDRDDPALFAMTGGPLPARGAEACACRDL